MRVQVQLFRFFETNSIWLSYFLFYHENLRLLHKKLSMFQKSFFFKLVDAKQKSQKAIWFRTLMRVHFIVNTPNRVIFGSVTMKCMRFLSNQWHQLRGSNFISLSRFSKLMPSACISCQSGMHKMSQIHQEQQHTQQ